MTPPVCPGSGRRMEAALAEVVCTTCGRTVTTNGSARLPRHRMNGRAR